MREILIFHRPGLLSIHSDFPQEIAQEIEDDMITFGYLLPAFIPVLTRHICYETALAYKGSKESFDGYTPYKSSCFTRNDTETKWGDAGAKVDVP